MVFFFALSHCTVKNLRFDDEAEKKDFRAVRDTSKHIRRGKIGPLKNGFSGKTNLSSVRTKKNLNSISFALNAFQLAQEKE